MRNEVPDYLKQAVNERVLEYLASKSSHGDLTEVFLKTIEGLAGVDYFYPNHKPYSYCMAVVDSTIFGFCQNMRSISFLLPENLHADACKDGGIPNEELEELGWFDFPAFDTNINPNCVSWANAAYLNARK